MAVSINNKNGTTTKVATNVNIIKQPANHFMTKAVYDPNGEVAQAGGIPEYVEDEIADVESQISELPTASAANLGKIYQYVGTTTASYTNGYFYKCVSDGAAQPSYLWQRWNVQPSGGGASTFTNSVSCSVGATSVQFTNPLNSTSIVVDPFSQSVSGEPKAILSMSVTASTITLTFAELTEATDFICRVESIS